MRRRENGGGIDGGEAFYSVFSFIVVMRDRWVCVRPQVLTIVNCSFKLFMGIDLACLSALLYTMLDSSLLKTRFS